MDYLVLAILGILPLITMIIFLLTRKNYDLLEPYTFFCIGNVVFPFFAMIHLTLYDGINETDYLWLSTDTFMSSYYHVSLVSFFCFLAYTIGYRSNPKVAYSLANGVAKYDIWSKKKLALFGVIYLLLGLYGLIEFALSLGISFSDIKSLASFSSKRFYGIEGEYSAAKGYHRWMALLSSVVYIFVTLYIFFTSKRLKISHWLLIVFLFMMATLFPLFTSSRSAIVTLIFITIIMWHYARKSISFFNISILMLIIILLAIGMGSLRKGGAIDISDVTNQIVLKLGEYGTHGYANLAYIYESVPNSMDYQYGKSFTSWIFAPIPRSIWPDKPPITIGQQIKTEIYSKTEEGGGGEGTNSIGELYINFGVFGFVLAVLYWFVAGIFSRKIYVTLKPYLRRNKAAIIIYVIFLFYIIPIFLGSFSRLLIKLFIYAVPMLFFLKIISYHRCIYVGGVSPKS